MASSTVSMAVSWTLDASRRRCPRPTRGAGQRRWNGETLGRVIIWDPWLDGVWFPIFFFWGGTRVDWCTNPWLTHDSCTNPYDGSSRFWLDWCCHKTGVIVDGKWQTMIMAIYGIHTDPMGNMQCNWVLDFFQVLFLVILQMGRWGFKSTTSCARNHMIFELS